MSECQTRNMTTTTTTLLSDLQNADPTMLLMLSQQVNKLKHSLDTSSYQEKSHRRNSMPLKKRYKADSFCGSMGTISPQLSPMDALTATAATPALVGGISFSSLASLSALLGKKIPEPSSVDIATRLEAFKEARRRSHLSRELLARATQAVTGFPPSSTPSLAATLGMNALAAASAIANRRHSLSSTSSLGAGGVCSHSGSFGATANSAFSPVGQAAAMASW